MTNITKTTIKRDGRVFLGDKHIGRIESYEGSKTGFKRGLCVGQVPCTRWDAWDAAGDKLPGITEMGGFCRGRLSRADAVAALVKRAEAAT